MSEPTCRSRPPTRRPSPTRRTAAAPRARGPARPRRRPAGEAAGWRPSGRRGRRRRRRLRGGPTPGRRERTPGTLSRPGITRPSAGRSAAKAEPAPRRQPGKLGRPDLRRRRAARGDRPGRRPPSRPRPSRCSSRWQRHHRLRPEHHQQGPPPLRRPRRQGLRLKSTGQPGRQGGPARRPLQHRPGQGQERLREGPGPVGARQGSSSRRPPAQLALGKARSSDNVIWVDTQNAELNSHNAYLTALDKLIVYGIARRRSTACWPVKDEGPERRARPGQDDPPGAGRRHRHQARRRAGELLRRYGGPDGHLADGQALGLGQRLSKVDQSEVHLGQPWVVQFPYIDQKIAGHVEHISTKVDPVTRTLKVRATIPNPQRPDEGRHARHRLHRGGPEGPGQTVIPRNALSVLNRENCVFIQRSDNPGKFERRKIEIDQERNDQVVVADGLEHGEMVAARGSLVLAQIYEDERTVATASVPSPADPSAPAAPGWAFASGSARVYDPPRGTSPRRGILRAAPGSFTSRKGVQPWPCTRWKPRHIS